MKRLVWGFCFILVGTVFPVGATQYIYRGAKTVVPEAVNPQAIIKKPVRWYRLDEKVNPDACDYERPDGVAPECSRWFHAVMPPETEKPKRIIVLEGINFDFDKYSIREDSIPILKDNVRDLTEFWIMKIKVIGHTDSIGTDKYNQVLSEMRAKAVMDYFVREGVEESHITFEGRGEKQPVAPNKTSDGRFKNRRIEIHIL